jgi:NADH-quinone oxidoreductase subunit A
MLIDYLSIRVLFRGRRYRQRGDRRLQLPGTTAAVQAQLMPYESGMEPIGPARRRFPIKFYRVALLFLIFDIEVIFLFPYTLVYRSLGAFGLAAMGVFFIILLVGLIYEWKRLCWNGNSIYAVLVVK